MAAQKTPAWVWIGCGCMLMVLLLIGAVAGVSFFGVNMFKSMVEDMADPLARADATMELLGAETLPEGWYSHAFFTFPFVMKIAILSDGDPGEAIEGSFEEKVEAMENLVLRHDQLGRNIFLYMSLRGRGEEAFEEVLAGKNSGASVNLDIDLKKIEDLGSGELVVGSQSLEWRAARGSMETMGGAAEGIYAVIDVRCATGERHDAIWFQRLEPEETPAPGAEASATETSDPAASELEVESGAEPAAESGPTSGSAPGTPAEPAAIEWLFGHFDVC
ncbi:MAG: hypothetical protein AAF725_14835 [Acidobacteriota bacterium]